LLLLIVAIWFVTFMVACCTAWQQLQLHCANARSLTLLQLAGVVATIAAAAA